jgi:2',3'-cyclic-nucleotide 2'-phosphodiesterase (5'-nucleotidase family)
MKRCIPLAAFACLLLSFTAHAEAKKLTLLVTGDNWGEVTQCGCTNIPTGGLARRKVVVDQARAKGPTLLLDAGNALFQETPADQTTAMARAEFILKTMGEMQTAAMAVGLRDMNAGPEFLKKTAKKTNMKLLSANFVLKGKKFFEPSTVVTVGESRIGLVGVGTYPEPLGAPAAPAVMAEVTKLKEKDKVDAVIVLAAMPLDDALQLSKEVGESVDLIFQSTDARAPAVPRKEHSNFLITTGRRGQMVASVELDLSGTGPLVDLGQIGRDKMALTLLEQRMEEAKKRLATLKEPAQQKSAQETLKGLEDRKAQLLASIASLQGRSGRSLSLTTLVLGPNVIDDPVIKAEAEKIQPPGSEKNGTATSQPPPGDEKLEPTAGP